MMRYLSKYRFPVAPPTLILEKNAALGIQNYTEFTPVQVANSFIFKDSFRKRKQLSGQSG